MTARLARSAGLIGLATLSSRVLGLVRDMAVAFFFATGYRADAFNVATRFASLLRDLFAEGAMSAAFVPTFTRAMQRDGRAAAWTLGSQVVNALLLVTGLITVAGILFAGPLVWYYAGDYAKIPGKIELTIWLFGMYMRRSSSLTSTARTAVSCCNGPATRSPVSPSITMIW
jgi:putative peptidoglycan lipid II flippase